MLACKVPFMLRMLLLGQIAQANAVRISDVDFQSGSFTCMAESKHHQLMFILLGMSQTIWHQLQDITLWLDKLLLNSEHTQPACI